jgi:PAS domain-containing protein
MRKPTTTAPASWRSPPGPAAQPKRRRAGAQRPTIRTPGASGQVATLLERVSDGFVAFDTEMNYTYINKRGGELLGRKPEDLIGKNYWKEYPEAKGTGE